MAASITTTTIPETITERTIIEEGKTTIEKTTEKGKVVVTTTALKKFQCTYAGCTVGCDTKHGIDRHVAQKHHKRFPYNCQYCGKGFANKAPHDNHVYENTCRKANNDPVMVAAHKTVAQAAQNQADAINSLITQVELMGVADIMQQLLEIKAHNETIAAENKKLNVDFGAAGTKLMEATVQARLEKLHAASHFNITTDDVDPRGEPVKLIVDLLTHDKIIEIKKSIDWKKAIAQIKKYRAELAKKGIIRDKLEIHLYQLYPQRDKFTDTFKQMVETEYAKHGITATYEPEDMTY